MRMRATLTRKDQTIAHYEFDIVVDGDLLRGMHDAYGHFRSTHSAVSFLEDGLEIKFGRA